MEKKQRLFIYDRREVVTLVALGLMVAAFAFTLGVHLGKRVMGHTAVDQVADTSQIPTLQDNVPNKQELKEQSKDASNVADEELSKTLKHEVIQSKVRIKSPRQVDLPSGTKSKTGGATTVESAEEKTNLKALQKIGKQVGHQEAESAPEKTLQEPSGKYTLQVGSYPTEEEAKERVDSLREHGLNPFLRSAQVKGLGLRYRLFVGGFASREEAEKSGKEYQAQHVIHSFLVSNLGG